MRILDTVFGLTTVVEPQPTRSAMRFAPALRFFRRSSVPRRQEPDPADLGTAFGLDACLDGSEPGDYRQHVREELLESQMARSPQDSPLAWLARRSA